MSVGETVFDELKRYVRFGAADETTLRAFAPLAAPHFEAIVDVFYARIVEHPGARAVLSRPEQVQRLKRTLCGWLSLLLDGPWDAEYFERRARIGRVHVTVALPQRYMFGAMNVIRMQLCDVARRELPELNARERVIDTLHKLLDIELAVMLESYREATVDLRAHRAERLAALGTMAAGLAHELRNPLNSAGLQLNVARRKVARASAPDLDSARVAIDLAQSEMTRLAELVDDFLQFAKPHPLRLALGDVRCTAEVVVALVAHEAEQAGVALVLEPGDSICVELDHEKMKQVVLNLVRNALQVAPRGSKVAVRVGRTGDSATLSVEDMGPGVPSNAPIFEPFFTTKEKGAGLGLSIVHRIVLDHGGTVGVESAPGRTVFTVALPCAA